MARTDGLEVNPPQKTFDLEPDAPAGFTFDVTVGRARPGYAYIAAGLTYGNTTETVAIRAQVRE